MPRRVCNFFSMLRAILLTSPSELTRTQPPNSSIQTLKLSATRLPYLLYHLSLSYRLIMNIIEAIKRTRAEVDEETGNHVRFELICL